MSFGDRKSKFQTEIERYQPLDQEISKKLNKLIDREDTKIVLFEVPYDVKFLMPYPSQSLPPAFC